jgi:hypothetical protein
MSFLTRKRAILSKIETTYGVDPTPTAGSDALLMSNLTVSPMEMTVVQRQNIKAYMGNNPSVLAAIYAKVSFDIELAGSGTAGTAPAYDELLRGCALSATTLAAPVTGTLTAGSATSGTLPASASSSDGTYSGMTVYVTGGTGSGQSAVIASYVGATKVATFTSALGTPLDATSVISIPAQVVYKPVSSNLESVTFYCYVDSILHKMTGARGSVALKASAQGIPMLTFTFTGLFTTPSDATIPAVTLTQFQQPLAINGINTTNLNVSGFLGAVCADFSFDLANATTFRSLPGGADNVVLTDRQPSGSITIEATPVSTGGATVAKDWWTLIKNVTLGVFSVTHGTVAGNKVKIDAPQQQLASPAYADKDGITMLTMKQTFVPASGNDELTLCFM